MYYQGSTLLEREVDTCDLQKVIYSIKIAHASGRFEPKRLVMHIAGHMDDLMEHAKQAVAIHQETHDLLVEDEYFTATREQYREIGEFLNTLLGETHAKATPVRLRASADLNPLEQLIEGIMKGMSSDGKTLGKCYDRVEAIYSDFGSIGDAISMVASGKGNMAIYSMLFYKLYNHVNAAKEDCQIQELAAALFDASKIRDKFTEMHDQLRSLLTTTGMQLMMKNFEAAGKTLGQIVQDILGFSFN